MSKNISHTIKKIRDRNKGDYLVYLKKGLTWKFYQQSVINSRKGI